MGAPIITQQTTVICGHSGTVTHTPKQKRVRVSGALAAVANDPFTVAGCTLAASGGTPCTNLTWRAPAKRVKAGGQSLLTHSGLPMGVGPAVISAGQMRVKAL
jgi:hypothetical protein